MGVGTVACCRFHVVQVTTYRALTHVGDVRFKVERRVAAVNKRVKVGKQSARSPLFVILVGNKHDVLALVAVEARLRNAFVAVCRTAAVHCLDVVILVLFVEGFHKVDVHLFRFAFGVTGKLDNSTFLGCHDVAVVVKGDVLAAALFLTSDRKHGGKRQCQYDEQCRYFFHFFSPCLPKFPQRCLLPVRRCGNIVIFTQKICRFVAKFRIRM